MTIPRNKVIDRYLLLTVQERNELLAFMRKEWPGRALVATVQKSHLYALGPDGTLLKDEQNPYRLVFATAEVKDALTGEKVGSLAVSRTQVAKETL